MEVNDGGVYVVVSVVMESGIRDVVVFIVASVEISFQG